MKTIHLSIISAALALATAPRALADVPDFVPLSGTLVDAQDVPLDGVYTVTFSLYTAESATVAEHTETKFVTVEQGQFTTALDDASLDMALFRDNPTLFLGVKVGADPEMEPRLQLGSTPFAALSQYTVEAQTLSGLAASDVALSTHSHSWSEVTSKPAQYSPEAHAHDFSTLQNIPAGLSDGDQDTYPTMTCNSGTVLTWTGSAFDCVTDQDTQYAAAASGGLTLSSREFSIATGGITNAHMAANAAIAPSKISGTAWTGTNDGSGSGLDADLLDSLNSTDFQRAFKKTIVVSPVGTDAQNGTAFLAAVDQANTAAGPDLILVEPGTYDVGNNLIQLNRPLIAIRGFGYNNTKIRSTYKSTTGAVVMSSSSTIADIEITVGGVGLDITGVALNSQVLIQNARIIVGGGTSSNVAVLGPESMQAGKAYLNDVRISADGGATYTAGIRMDGGKIEANNISVYSYSTTNSQIFSIDLHYYEAVVRSSQLIGGVRVDKEGTSVNDPSGLFLATTISNGYGNALEVVGSDSKAKLVGCTIYGPVVGSTWSTCLGTYNMQTNALLPTGCD